MKPVAMRCFGAACLVISVAAPLQAGDLFSTSNGRSSYAAATRVLDTRAAQQYAASVRLTPRAVAVPGAGGIPAYTGSYRGKYLRMARNAARSHGIPEDLFLRLVQQESGWKPNAVSRAGALGLAQWPGRWGWRS